MALTFLMAVYAFLAWAAYQFYLFEDEKGLKPETDSDQM
jgi:hypothetical protein